MRYKERVNFKIDPDYYETLAMVESSGNPNAQAQTSSAAGLYQFTEGTWKNIVKQSGLNYTLGDRFDPVKSKKAVELLTAQNQKYLKSKLDRDLGQGDLYLAHMMGMGGAEKILTAEPNQTVDTVVSKAALKANKSVFYNEDGSLKTVADIQNWSRTKFGESPIDYTPSEVAQSTTTPKYTPAEDPIIETEVERDNTSVSSTDRYMKELIYQNEQLLQNQQNKTKEEEVKTKAQIAQAKLDEKVQQRNFLQDLIMQSGAKFVERAPRQSAYDIPEANSPGYPEIIPHEQ